jgi:hypothetical protein
MAAEGTGSGCAFDSAVIEFLPVIEDVLHVFAKRIKERGITVTHEARLNGETNYTCHDEICQILSTHGFECVGGCSQKGHVFANRAAGAILRPQVSAHILCGQRQRNRRA